MTIAISLKVNDGLVLAADSASTLVSNDPQTRGQVVNVYDNANKIINLVKGRPIGIITWGSGAIGRASISTLAKDLRQRLTGNHAWALPADYKIEDVAARLRSFMYEEFYVPEYQAWKDDEKPALGFLVGGYSSGVAMAEEYKLDIGSGKCDGPNVIRGLHECGLTWSGMPQAITRLIMGVDPGLAGVLKDKLGVEEAKIPAALQVIRESLQMNLVSDAMPIQDAIDLAEFLVDLTIKYTRFSPGAQVVGGPIEIAAITKHEGFKWVKRKHYFSDEFNPRG